MAVKLQSIVLSVLALFVSIGAVWWGRVTLGAYCGPEEVILDEGGLTMRLRVGARTLKRHVPLAAIDFFAEKHSGQGTTDSCVTVYSDGETWSIGGYRGYNGFDMDWVAQYLASGCALLRGTAPEHFLYSEPRSTQPAQPTPRDR